MENPKLGQLVRSRYFGPQNAQQAFWEGRIVGIGLKHIVFELTRLRIGKAEFPYSAENPQYATALLNDPKLELLEEAGE